MEEASVAGESPDRSKQRESSAEQTSGSAGPVPEKQDPRLAVARGTESSASEKPASGDGGDGRGSVDTATRVLSVREESADTEVPADAEESAEVPADVAESAEDSDATDTAAPEEADETSASEAPEAPQSTEAPEGGSTATDGDGRLREAVAAWVRSAEPAEGTGKDAPAADAEAEETSRDDAGTADDDVEADTEDTQDTGAASADDDVKADAEDGHGPVAGTAVKADEDAKDAKNDASDADADTGASEADDAPEGDDAPKGADSDDSEASTADETPSAPEADADGPDGPEDADAAPRDAEADAETDADTDAPSADNEGATDDSAEADEADEADDEGKGKADAPTPGSPDAPDAPGPAKAGAGASKGSVDQPTAVFRAPRPSAPSVDQPTTMLKLGDAAAAREKAGAAAEARSAEAERTSKFVALKRLDDPAVRQPPRQGGPAPAESTTFLPQVGPERTTQQPLPPKPPLDLLAELTNTPPPPQTPLRTAVRRVKIWTPLVILLVIAFAVVQNVRPLPAPTLVLTAEDSYTFKGGKPDIPWPENGQAALDVEGIGTFGSSGEQKPVPIASVAKVMTAYVILRDHPLKSGAEGPKIKIDALAEEQSDAGQESTVNVTEGDEISEREAIEAILIASANNVARLLARWDAGSEEAFVEKMNKAAEDLGMADTTYTDPSGLNNTTVSTAVDQVKLARAAMQFPSFREVAAMMSYVDYKGERYDNWNRLVGHDDVVGIKTGTTTSALGNLSFAAKKDVDGEVQRIVGAVLRQPEGGEDNTILSGALEAGHNLILAGQDALRAETILKKGEVVGYADDGLGGRTPVAVTEDVKAVGWAGLSVKLTFAGTELPQTAKAGTRVGTLTVGDGKNGAVKVPVALQKDLVEPGFTDKLTRLT
ncbi:D-alanyl-D-alanine carboxypeptidase [Streptomyces sp. RO-S4]|uniref:D-alanyl-D-alanine carboxypeptidase n=1 Tax=Streptomyces sp. RO-S4 TaxID=2902486 RepID=UPI00208EEA85|nr:D-alanyl-D-alanine carboxypeptidase [Streptomyces sp. RO-S4]